MPWTLYDKLIGGVPEGILVTNYCLGPHWSYLEAECGMGIAWTARGGAARTVKADLRGRELREVAGIAKSWNFTEATLGIAALNAWYSRREMVDPLGAEYDEPGVDGRKTEAFDMMRPQIERVREEKGSARVTVVGHFPRVERIAEYAQLTVLERNCTSELDTPDPACEYVMPGSDFAFITGVTLINKTAPRLLQLARDAYTVMLGPSVVMSPALFEHGVDMMSGSVVDDPEKTRFAVQTGAGRLFGDAVAMACVRR